MQNTYLVVEQDPLVASDLYEIVTDYDAQASVTVVISVDEVVGILEESAKPITVIVSSSAEVVNKSGMASAIQTSQSRLILIDAGHQVECDVMLGWAYVKAPFTTAALVRALDGFNPAER